MPTGIFDSGVGGLSVLREIKELLPRQDLLYYADSAYCPYGVRNPAEIRARSLAIARFLVEQGAGLIVAACNTASIAALECLREQISTPVVGMEPAVKPAAAATRNGRIGVLATAVTLAGARYNHLKEKYAAGIEVVSAPCPGLVEMVEAGSTFGPDVDKLLTPCLARLLDRGVDTVVLGSTHYHFLRDAVQRLAGPNVLVIDTAAAVARRTREVLGARADGEQGRIRFFTSGRAAVVQPVMRRLLNDPLIEVIEKAL